jgi:hypothetical protein
MSDVSDKSTGQITGIQVERVSSFEEEQISQGKQRIEELNGCIGFWRRVVIAGVAVGTASLCTLFLSATDLQDSSAENQLSQQETAIVEDVSQEQEGGYLAGAAVVGLVGGFAVAAASAMTIGDDKFRIENNEKYIRSLGGNPEEFPFDRQPA